MWRPPPPNPLRKWNVLKIYGPVDSYRLLTNRFCGIFYLFVSLRAHFFLFFPFILGLTLSSSLPSPFFYFTLNSYRILKLFFISFRNTSKLVWINFIFIEWSKIVGIKVEQKATFSGLFLSWAQNWLTFFR